jgi:hypothetical protein
VPETFIRRSLRARGLPIFAFFALLWVWLAWPWLSGDVTIPYDAKAHFQAQIQFLANALHRGESPFWTPNIFGGSPQIADPQSLIFSPALLLALFDKAPSFRTMDAYVLGLLLVGGLAVAQFGRERGWHPAACVVAGLVFAFGASASWRLQHVGQVQSLACFAVALWLLSRALAHASWRSGLAAGAAAGVMIAQPDQIDLLSSYLLAAYVVWFICKDGRPFVAARQVWPALAAGGVVGLAIIALPVLMAILFSGQSNRAAMSFVEAARGSLHPASLLTAFVGDLFGAKDANVDFWGPSSAYWAPGSLTLSQNMGQIYVGALPVTAIILWLAGGLRGLDAEARFWLGALAAMILYALGAHTPLFSLIFQYLPGAHLFRRPADATFMIGAVAALLAGFAVHGLIGGARAVTFRQVLVAAAALLAALAGAAMVAALHGRFGVAWPSIALAFLSLGASLAALAWLSSPSLASPGGADARGPAGPRAVAAMALLLAGGLAADLRINNGPNESTALPPSQYAVMEPNTDNDTIAYLKAVLANRAGEPARRDRVELLGTGFHWPNLGMIHGFDHAFGYNPLHMAEFTEATGAQDHMGGPQDRKFTAMFPSFRSTFADMLGLRYVVSAVPIARVDRSLKPGDLTLLARTRDGFIYENPKALARAMFVPEARGADFERLLEQGLPAGFDPRSEVLLEQPPTPRQERRAEGSEAASVRIVSYANTEIIVEVASAQAGFLVLNDVWHPWWGASVNGKPAEILKANVLFRAVQVEAGKSVVTFQFKPLDGVMEELREMFMPEPEAPASVALAR